MYVREVAAAPAGDQDFLADPRRMLQQCHPPPPTAGVDRTHHAGTTRADNNHVVLAHGEESASLFCDRQPGLFPGRHTAKDVRHIGMTSMQKKTCRN